MNEVLAPTKDRILDAAERLFGQNGIDGTSLRAITAEADVNLAAVNYHFQSKEALVYAVLARRLAPVNRQRLEMLEELESAANGDAIPIPQLLEAFLRPVIEMRFSCAKDFVPMMARLYSEQRASAGPIFKEHFGEVARRFFEAFQRSLPHLPPIEVGWRMHFMVGAMVHTIAGQHILRGMLPVPLEMDNVEGTLARLIGFFSLALESPASEVNHAR